MTRVTDEVAGVSEDTAHPVRVSKRARWVKRGALVLVGLLVMVAVFAFLIPRFADYGQALTSIKAMNPLWVVALVAASLLNIAIYPLTANAAIPHLAYRAAFTSRTIAYTLSNVIPGGGAVSVAAQYATLASYRVPGPQAAAAVASDGAWTSVIILASPTIAIGLLLIEGDSTSGLGLAAAIGFSIVVAMITGIWMVLRSQQGAEKVAHWAQRPINAVFRAVHRTAPDVAHVILDFHEHASEMVKERWRSITVTNLAAQYGSLLILILALFGLGASPEPVTIVEAFAAFSISLLMTAIPITPGGLGTVDAVLIALLVRFGADASDALAADLVWRLVWFLPHVMVGLVAFGVYRWDMARKAHYQGVSL